jgi:hypothetical protein
MQVALDDGLLAYSCASDAYLSNLRNPVPAVAA